MRGLTTALKQVLVVGLGALMLTTSSAMAQTGKTARSVVFQQADALYEQLLEPSVRDAQLDAAFEQVRGELRAVHRAMLVARTRGDLDRTLCLAGQLARSERYYQIMEDSAGQLWTVEPGDASEQSIQLNRLALAWANARDGLDARGQCPAEAGLLQAGTLAVTVEVSGGDEGGRGGDRSERSRPLLSPGLAWRTAPSVPSVD